MTKVEDLNGQIAEIALRLEAIQDGQRAMQEKLNRLALTADALKAAQRDIVQLLSAARNKASE